MKKRVAILAAILLAMLVAVGVVLLHSRNSHNASGAPPNVRQMENTGTNDEILLQQIAQLRAQLDDLERKIAQQEFDYTALQAERDTLQRKSDALEEQNRYLRSRNSSLNSSESKLKENIVALDGEIATLNEKLAQLSKEREANEAAYQEALARIEEYQAQAAVAQEALTEANSPGTRVTEEGKMLSSFNSIPPGQSRNTLGIKIGPSDLDIEGTFALLPHWYLLADLGVVETPDDFVEKEFPGLTADHAFMYTALFGTGLNWRFNNIQSQPNLYIETMAGPTWYLYEDNGGNDMKTYLLWRTSVGFDLTLYKNLQFTTDVSVDWVKDYGFTPRLTLGLQWSFSNSWSLFGR